ncbi:MAG: SOS response-associated peptidase [Saprospiraceae bacterium]|nr:SOS response-associated peptidase [Saprospiraceae bacterium]
MCGRSSLTKSEKELEARFKATFYSEDLEKYNPLPNYNVAPTHVMPILSNADPNHFVPMRWGLIPYWAKDIKVGYKMINARKETVLEKAAFKQSVARRRCLVPMDGYYEWKKEGSRKTPYRIILTNQEIFSVAGLWENWKTPDGQMIQSYTVLTQTPSPSLAHIHDRMPAILTHDQEQAWLDMEIPPKDALAMINPYPDDLLQAYIISSRIGKVTENDAELIKPKSNPTDLEQSTLF